MANTSSHNRSDVSSQLRGETPQVSEGMASVAWLSAGALTAAVMVMLLHGGFGSRLKQAAKSAAL